MRKLLIFIFIPYLLSSCLNYIPCRGQDYIIEGITHKELIDKFNEFRDEHPEYKSYSPDREAEDIPHYYIKLYWSDLGIEVHCDIHIGDKMPNPPTHLNFTLIKDCDGYKDINSKELPQEQNEFYKNKFESDILDGMGVNWTRKDCR